MVFGCRIGAALAGVALSGSASFADTLPTHRIPAALAIEAASETVSACAKQGYHETALVLDADGATIVALRGDGAGIHTLDSAHDKAYTAVSFKNDTIALAERAKGEDSIAPLAKLPHVMFFGGGVVIKLGERDRLAPSAPPARRAPNWMTPAHTPAWRKSGIVCSRREPQPIAIDRAACGAGLGLSEPLGWAQIIAPTAVCEWRRARLERRPFSRENTPPKMRCGLGRT